MAHHFVGDRGACGLDADEHEWRDGRLVCPAWLTAPDPAPTTDEEHPMEKTFSIASTQPAKLIIAAPDGRVAAEISGDGVLTFGDGFGATEAAEAFVAAVRGLLPVDQLTVAPAADATRQTLAHTLRDHEPDQSLTDDEYWLAEADHVLSSPWMAAHDAMMLEGKDYQLRRANRIRQNQMDEIEQLRERVDLVTCDICEELITPGEDTISVSDSWVHRDCAEAGE
jgi:hypothetical protein